MKTKCILFIKDKVTTGEFNIRELKDQEVLIKTIYSCVSPGTELRCLRGGEDVPTTPFIPGYALVGEVIKSLEENIKVGTMVHCSGSKDTGSFGSSWGGHLSYAIADGSSLTTIPENVKLKEAALTSLGGIAYHGFQLSKVKENENVAVIGLGVLGQLSARLHSIAGGNVVCSDRVTERVKISNSYGIKSISNDSGLKPAFQSLQPNGATLIVDATGIPTVIDEAIDLFCDIPWDNSLEPNTRYLIQGSYSSDISFSYQKAFVKQVSFLVPRNRQMKDHQAFINLLAEQKITVDDLITKIYKPKYAEIAYKELGNSSAIPGTILFEW